MYLVHVSAMRGVPKALKDVLSDPNIRKAGRNVGGDAAKILRDWNVQTHGVVELGRLCRERGFVENGQASLAALVAAVLNERMPKDDGARFSAWDAGELSDEQKTYAALDAWASLVVTRAALLLPDRTMRLTAETALPGDKVDLVIGKKTVASGEILPDDTWGGVACKK